MNADESTREDPKSRKYKQARKTADRNIIVTEAEVQLLDKRVNTELGRIKKAVDANLESFKETLMRSFVK